QNLQLGAQNVGRFADDGPYTGKVSAGMLIDIGCQYVIVGHSERRRAFSETQIVLRDKIIHAQEAGLTPIFCIGETLQERQSGEYLAILFDQLESLRHASLNPFVVAYEPIWAIGTQQVAQVEQIAEVHAKIKGWLLLNRPDSANIRILYGGSVNASNATQVFATANVDGALVGGSSLSVGSFAKICAAALL
ncbi:MAG: triose-phosphate isomerase, partial [Gammaproteobacteria bacterium]|nr:triose-phosphate isomerase [Gammaproteobacteria bacterium]